MRIVIVGGSFAGIQTAISLRNDCPESEIIIIEKQARIGFIPNSVNLILKGEFHEEAHHYWITKEQLTQEHQIAVRVETEVTALNSDKNQIQLNDGEILSFDFLVIATGSQQRFRFSTQENDTIWTIKDPKTSQQFQQRIGNAKKIAVVGAGQVGLELIEGLANLGKELHLYESQSTVLFRYFDPEMIKPLYRELNNRGIRYFLNEQVQEIIEAEQTKIFTEKRSETYDLVLLANYTRPDNQLWEESLRLNDDGTIWVNDYLQTSQENIYAIGDAIQVTYRPTQEKMYVSLVNNAIRTAKIASKNISGQQKKDLGTYRPIGNHWFGHYFGSVGLTESESIFYDGEINTQYLTTRASAANQELIQIKVLLTEEGKLIGAQCHSQAVIFYLLDRLTLAVEEGWTLADLEAREFFFQPEYRAPTALVKVVDSFDED
ncbi:FAD-dependent oxidoreductase [Enterococcus mundtii]|uniref:Pyridine nucleotide-disulfide oxidoreductase n=1 Tax=Enterococcus mundtii TaxID=53346 RepID=A0A1V2UE80_ENTMU|nr:FAD-dependent oxidoreductase [Enterococcus mundtii]ONN41616.1 pyridine nucleotide-disulfide oxidoreductase [Enterococcus mundtii]